MLLNKILEFDFEGRLVRTDINEDNELWFIAKDVCTVLGLENNRMAVRTLDPEEKIKILVETPGGPQEMIAVSETGLYSLIFQSRKPNAQKFIKWITSEVIPSLRRNGYYGMPSSSSPSLPPPPLPPSPPIPPRHPALPPDILTSQMERAARALPMRYREKAMSFAVQLVKGGRCNPDEAWEPLYLKICWRLIDGDALETGPGDAALLIHQWGEEELEPCERQPGTPGMQALNLYKEFQAWVTDLDAATEGTTPMPSFKVFNRVMRKTYAWTQSNKLYYHVRRKTRGD